MTWSHTVTAVVVVLVVVVVVGIVVVVVIPWLCRPPQSAQYRMWVRSDGGGVSVEGLNPRVDAARSGREMEGYTKPAGLGGRGRVAKAARECGRVGNDSGVGLTPHVGAARSGRKWRATWSPTGLGGRWWSETVAHASARHEIAHTWPSVPGTRRVRATKDAHKCDMLGNLGEVSNEGLEKAMQLRVVTKASTRVRWYWS
ncbi:hypothetical protein EDB85DRAFT_1895385 [Lactarius pseudohatsudake]|nr:hypothetical protein EDB85DRAFT_1895385 [Lactarius pseudohatsudake]